MLSSPVYKDRLVLTNNHTMVKRDINIKTEQLMTSENNVHTFKVFAILLEI